MYRAAPARPGDGGLRLGGRGIDETNYNSKTKQYIYNVYIYIYIYTHT